MKVKVDQDANIKVDNVDLEQICNRFGTELDRCGSILNIFGTALDGIGTALGHCLERIWTDGNRFGTNLDGWERIWNGFGRMGTHLKRIWTDGNAFGMHLDGLGTHLERRSEKGQQLFDVGRSH